MVPTLLVSLFIGVVLSLTPIKTYATKGNGVEVINLLKPALGYAANLNYNRVATNKNTTLFFTADKSNPNLFTAGVTEDGSFYSTGKSYFPDLALEPFVAFDIATDVAVGIVLPGNSTGQDLHGTMLRAALAKGYNKGEWAISEAATMQGYNFFSVKFDTSHASFQGEVPFYATGWANDDVFDVKGFFVLRGTVNISSPVPTLEVQWDRDVSSTLVTTNCYDTYNEVKKPKMWIDGDYLYVAIVGRCATVTKTKLGEEQFKYTVWHTPFFPAGKGDDRYVSDADLDPGSGYLFFSLQDYNRRDRTTIQSIDMRGFVLTKNVNSIDTQGESHVLLHFAQEDSTRSLFVLASGATRLFRFNITADNSLTYDAMAIIPDELDGLANIIFISYAANCAVIHFYRPYLYWTTYTRDAAIARIHSHNFCKNPCPQYGFCNAGVCNCQDAWAPVYNGSTLVCVNKLIVETEERYRENESSAIALGVLFAFTSAIAGTGWYMWRRQKYL